MWVDSRGRGVFRREASERECWRGDRQGGLKLPKLVLLEREVQLETREGGGHFWFLLMRRCALCGPRTHFLGIFVEYLNICDTVVHELRVNIGGHACASPVTRGRSVRSGWVAPRRSGGTTFAVS